VLVVDDNERSRGLIMELLAFWKARGEQAGNAEAALDLLRASAGDPFDAVLVDLEMPGMSGDQLGALMQRQPEWARAPMILLTPLSQAADAARWRRLGFAGHVGKPVKQGELGTLLAAVMGYGPPPARSGPPPKQSGIDRELRAGLDLLVVEDNKVNQEVTLGILENLGYRADVVEDGLCALAALGRKDYDLVLMDCQLPGMDGYEASRLIREPETEVRNHEIPIIATTAHALAGDREKCLAAGMNGYIAKPLRPDALEQAIEEWTGGLDSALEPPSPLPCPVTVPAAPKFDREDFVERLMGDRKLARRIIRGFVEDIPRQIVRLAEAVSKRDATEVRLVAHSIKGAAASVCGPELREVAWDMEQKGSAGNLTAAAAALPELTASFERVKPIMESFCDEDPDEHFPAASNSRDWS
jgi:two-component system, sensor histidine kinase and response regulator